MFIYIYTERQKKLYKSYISNYFHSVEPICTKITPRMK